MGEMIACDDCGRRISVRARACPGCGRPVPRRSRLVPALIWLAACVGALVVVGLFLDAAGFGSAGSPAGLRPGDPVRLEVVGASGVWLAADDESFDAMLDAQNARSGDLMRRLSEGGKVSFVPNGSAGVLVKSATFCRFVRVTDGPAIGSEGWVQGEHVGPR